MYPWLWELDYHCFILIGSSVEWFAGRFDECASPSFPKNGFKTLFTSQRRNEAKQIFEILLQNVDPSKVLTDLRSKATVSPHAVAVFNAAWKAAFPQSNGTEATQTLDVIPIDFAPATVEEQGASLLKDKRTIDKYVAVCFILIDHR